VLDAAAIMIAIARERKRREIAGRGSVSIHARSWAVGLASWFLRSSMLVFSIDAATE